MIIRTGILCVPEIDDEAVTTIVQLLKTHLPTVLLVETTSAGSQRNWIEERLRCWCDEEELDLVVTIGGTAPAAGPTAAEIVPEATHAVVERPLPGFAEAMRAYAAEESLLAWLERGITGIRGHSLLINLPAGAAPALLFLKGIITLVEPVLLHLHTPQNAPSLSDVLTIQSLDDSEDRQVGSSVDSSIASPHSALQAEEFAVFLQRNSSPTNPP